MLSASLRNGWIRLSSGAASALLLIVGVPASADEPLHQRIDQLIAAGKPGFDKQAAPIAGDAEFLRRIYLDLIGTIPTSAEARAFLADSSPDKRAQLIDALLARPEHARHMQNTFDVLLIERRPDKFVPRADWQAYLYASFAANKPWDQLVREILSADGSDPTTRPAAKFYLDRDGEPNTLTRDISRLFLGMNLTCAQCHDSPIVPDYKQDFYYGIFAFYNRSFLFNARGRGAAAIFAEKADGEVSFQSVFDPNKITKTTGPRLPEGELVKEPVFPKGKEYQVKPANGVRPVPSFSRRARIAGLLASAANAPFKRSSANRFWALLMGRGLIHPLDLDHSGNPPSHPELLDLLGDEFAAHQFNIRWLLRELALSQTYQRSAELPPGMKEPRADSFAVAQLKPLTPEQLAWSLMQATGLTDAQRKALGAKATADAIYGRLAGNVTTFATLFGGAPGQPADPGFQATLDQTLFVSNGTLLRTWLVPQVGNLTDRLGHLKEADAVAEELYLSILTRPPSAQEKQETVDYLSQRSADRAAALQELTWALLASAEFRFNH
jgi:hypothetical protein